MTTREMLENACERNPELKRSMTEYMGIRIDMLKLQTNFKELMASGKLGSPEANDCISRMKECNKRLGVLVDELKTMNFA